MIVREETAPVGGIKKAVGGIKKAGPNPGYIIRLLQLALCFSPEKAYLRLLLP